MDTHGQGFIEGNAFNYGLYVPQNVPEMIKMMGGKNKFSKHLDEIFTTEIADKYIEKTKISPETESSEIMFTETNLDITFRICTIGRMMPGKLKKEFE
jgi:Putative alpha-1,2-mannosidase